MDYVAPPWLPGGHLQTIAPALVPSALSHAQPVYRRERWRTPDADFIDVDWQPGGTPQGPLLVLFHGLEGSSASHYARAFAAFARRSGWSFAVPHFRGCSGELNLAPRAYHCGDHAEIGWILAHLRQIHAGPMVAAGVSLGGNALLRWAEEMGQQAGQVVQALAALSAPVDLAASGAAIGRGANRLLYTRMFLNTMKPRALQKLQQYPGLFDRQALLSARNLYDFDNVFTAPLHGFRDTDDYWQRASAKHALSAIRVPTLLLNARNDPFVPASSLPKAQEVGTYVTLWQPTQGGHAGFPAGRWSGQLGSMAEAVGHWLWQTIGAEAGLGHG